MRNLYKSPIEIRLYNAGILVTTETKNLTIYANNSYRFVILNGKRRQVLGGVRSDLHFANIHS